MGPNAEDHHSVWPPERPSSSFETYRSSLAMTVEKRMGGPWQRYFNRILWVLSTAMKGPTFLGLFKLNSLNPGEGEQMEVAVGIYKLHFTRYACSQLWGVQSGQNEIPSVALWTTLEVVHLDKRLQLVAHMPLPPSLSGEDGEQAVHGVARLAQGGGRWFLAQMGTEGAVVMKGGQIHGEEGRLDPALELVEG
ncbi:hypothetical protein F7725_002253 [Dissostichus mawsoni]|uniref:Uncharacterized protein n=1 Tax=Dissostichus mawsoni TaxID=36200 RepID=A0A7J5Y1W7_DISMA|nr:hypothetical protein F7725_002253 [Dissostichus mawsoni]